MRCGGDVDVEGVWKGGGVWHRNKCMVGVVALYTLLYPPQIMFLLHKKKKSFIWDIDSLMHWDHVSNMLHTHALH